MGIVRSFAPVPFLAMTTVMNTSIRIGGFQLLFPDSGRHGGTICGHREALKKRRSDHARVAILLTRSTPIQRCGITT